MKLAEVYAALESVDNGAALIGAIKAEMTKLSEEAKKHREAKQQADETVTKITKEKEELQAKVDAATKVDASANDDGTGTQAYKQLVEQVKALQETVETERSARKEAEEKRIRADIAAQTVNALTKSNATDPEEFAKLLSGAIKVKDDGTYSYTKTDGTEGTINDCVADWLKDRPWAVKNTQTPGSGGEGAPGGASGDEERKMVEKAMGL